MTRDDMISKDQPLIRLICIGADTHSAGLSALLLGEQGVFGAPTAAALVLVCAGIWLVNREGPSGR